MTVLNAPWGWGGWRPPHTSAPTTPAAHSAFERSRTPPGTRAWRDHVAFSPEAERSRILHAGATSQLFREPQDGKAGKSNGEERQRERADEEEAPPSTCTMYARPRRRCPYCPCVPCGFVQPRGQCRSRPALHRPPRPRCRRQAIRQSPTRQTQHRLQPAGPRAAREAMTPPGWLGCREASPRARGRRPPLRRPPTTAGTQHRRAVAAAQSQQRVASGRAKQHPQAPDCWHLGTSTPRQVERHQPPPGGRDRRRFLGKSLLDTSGRSTRARCTAIHLAS
jgi:hypothetical protein